MLSNVICNICGGGDGHLLYIGCCSQSFVHALGCTKDLNACINCGDEFVKPIQQYIENIKWSNDNTLRITTKWIIKQRRKHKARIETQRKIDLLLTPANLKKAWRSKESIEYIREYRTKRNQKHHLKKSLLGPIPFE